MKLQLIHEAYDKHLAIKVAELHSISQQDLRKWVGEIDRELKYGTWILKQLKALNREGTTPLIHDVTLQREISKSLRLFDDAKENSPDTLPAQDINRYSLDQLKSAVESYKPKKFDPGQLPGVTLLKEFETSEGFGIGQGGTARIRAYIIVDPNSLSELSQDQGWCVKNIRQAKTYIKRSPQIMIFRNNEPIVLGEAYGTELKNSQNADDHRPEVIKLYNELKNYHNLLDNVTDPMQLADIVENLTRRNNKVEHRLLEHVRAGNLGVHPLTVYVKRVITERWPELEDFLYNEDEVAAYISRRGKESFAELPMAYGAALGRAKGISTRSEQLENLLLKHGGIEQITNYCFWMHKDGWPEAEKVMLTSDRAASLAYDEEARRSILNYATYLRKKGEWPELEECIMLLIKAYTGRTGPAFESYVNNVCKLAANYAIAVKKARLPQLESMILQTKGTRKRYREAFGITASRHRPDKK